MASIDKRVTDRFSVPQSDVMLGNFRRPNYRVIKRDMSNESMDAASTFRIWTLEGKEKYCKKINHALLNDDYMALKEYQGIINELREAIKQHSLNEPLKVYHSIKLDSKNAIDEYQFGKMFLWPTLSGTSRDKHVALKFSGNYLFEINSSPRN